MADNAAQSIKDLSKDVEILDQRIAKSIELLQGFDKGIADLFEEARKQGIANTDQLVDYLAKKLNNLQIKTVVSPFLGAFDEKEIDKAAKKYAALLEKQDVVEKARSIAVGGRKFGELQGEDLKNWREFSALLTTINEQKKQIEQTAPGSAEAGQKLYNEQLAFQKAQETQSQERKRIAQEEAEVKRKAAEDERKLNELIAEEERKKTEAAKQKYKEALEANKALTKAEDDLAKSRREQRTAESKSAYNDYFSKQLNAQKQADRESMNIQRRQIQIKAEMAAIDKKRATEGKQLTSEEKARYREISSELTKLIARQKELDAISQGSGKKARGRLSKYEISEAEKAMRRYGNAVQDARNKQQGLNNETSKMLPTIQRLASAFGVAFSVRGLAQFGKKLIETRGEFEMQFVAMKQIIGDVDAATKIWNQTMQQALQSPFKAMQLVTYTKQLAAYRIETEKLFDTTKRLADVSAGLGVDMGRLILAYGQVKSANYLRASEVRQFTEAGVNIAGNLAKYFSELEGRAVGTAEVMERITKRMVLFSDVEAIFKRMTDEGGEFFNMQEVQADTVKGQIQKLHDAYDQMLNTIGQANQGTIRNFVDTLNNLVRNWQDVAFVLKANINWITIFGASLYALSNKYMKGATTQTLWFSKALTGNEKVLLKEAGAVRLFGNEVGLLSVKQRVGVIAMRSFQGAVMAVGKALSILWPLLVFEGITLLVERLTRANRELKRFREELQEVASTNVGQMDEEINGYDSLIERLKRTTEGTMARKEVLDEISRRYGKYLDFIITEKTSVEQLAGAYDNVVSSIRNYTAEKIREEQQQKLEKGLYDEYQDLINNLEGASIQLEGGWLNLSKSQAKNIAKLVEKSLKETGEVDLQSILEKYLGLDFDDASYERINYFVERIVNSYVKAYKGLKGELQEIRDDVEGQTPVFESEAEYEQYKKNVDDANKEIAAQNELYQEQVDLVKQKTEEQWKLDDEIAKLRLENEEKILGIRKEYGLISEGQYNDELARLHGRLDTYETDYNKRLAKAMSESYGETWQTSNKEARDMYNYVVSTEQALAQGTTQRNKQLKDSYKGFKESLEQYNAQFQAAEKSGASKEVLDKIQADIDLAKLMMSAIELAAELRGIDLSEKKKTSGTKENASKLISLIKEMRSEYDKLSKSAYGYAKSEEKVREAYADSVKAILGKAGITDYDFTTNEGMIAALEKVKTYATKLGKDAAAEVQKYIDQLETEIEINAQVKIREDFGKQMEEMFNNYELTIDLEKLDLPADEIAGIFDFKLTTIDALRKKVEDFYYEQAGRGDDPEELVKQVEGLNKKIDEMERKALVERLKKYTAYLSKGRDEAVKIHLEELKAMAEIDDLYDRGMLSEEMHKSISSEIRKETNEKLAKQTWKDFKESDYYTTMFQDLDHVASSSVDLMIKRLKKLQGSMSDLDPTQVKEIVQSIEKLENQKRQRSPFKSFIEDIKTWSNWNKKSEENDKWLNFYTEGEDYWLRQHKYKAAEVAQLEQEYNKLALDGEEENAAAAKNRWEFAKEELDDINERLEKYGLKIAEINDENNKGYAAMRRVLSGVAQGAQYFSEMASAAGNIATEMMDMFDGVDDASKKLAKDVAEIATNVGILAADIVKAIASEGSDVSSMIDGLVRTWNIIRASMSASEVEINRTIEHETKKIEELEDALDRLGRARDRAWDTAIIVYSEKEIEHAIEQQIEAYDAMISAEEQRKNKDESLLRQYRQEREDLFEQLQDEQEEFAQSFGGIGEGGFRDEAQGFVDAWKQAFLETGDGLQGLQDHFDEFLQEWFVKQATMRVASNMLEPLFRDIDAAVDKYGDGGTSVLFSELQRVRERFNLVAPQLSEALEELAGSWNLNGEGGLSGLAAGIQGMTEEQANILEAYWNSVRGYTASIDMNVARIAQILGAGGDNTNPQLQQLNLIAANTQATHQILQSVTKSGHSQGGYGIKVFAD